MDLKNCIEKYLWIKQSDYSHQNGLLTFEHESNYIKNRIKDNKKIGAEIYIRERREALSDRFEKYEKLISEETGIVRSIVSRDLNYRIVNFFNGILGEALFERLVNRTKNYQLINVSNEEDYLNRVDVRVAHKHTQHFVFFQIKPVSYLINPNHFSQTKIDNEKRIHKSKNLNVYYAFFEKDFNDRKFVINDNEIKFFGWGGKYNEVKEFERVLDLVFEDNKTKVVYEITEETIIF